MRSKYSGMGIKNKHSVVGFSPLLAGLPICLEHNRTNTAGMLAKPYRNFINLDDNEFAMSAPAPSYACSCRINPA